MTQSKIIHILLFAYLWFGNMLIAALEDESLHETMQAYKGKYRILFETYQENNFEIFIMDPDGTNVQNLTRTTDQHEFFPKASPDGTKICFMSYEGQGDERKRNLFLMNPDGSGRKRIVENGRWPCWSPDGKRIAFVRDYLSRFSIKDFATEGLYFYDVETGAIQKHPNKEIEHIYNLSWHPDGKWITAVIHGGMGIDHAIIALEVEGNRFNKLLGGNRCRPDFSPDGTHIAWCDLDWAIGVAGLRYRKEQYNIKVIHQIMRTSDHENTWTYHPDWSPDGKFVAFCQGPVGEDHPVDSNSPGTSDFFHAGIGVKADGWDICVVSARGGKWIQLTTDGKSNKEPDWIKVVDTVKIK